MIYLKILYHAVLSAQLVKLFAPENPVLLVIANIPNLGAQPEISQGRWGIVE